MQDQNWTMIAAGIGAEDVSINSVTACVYLGIGISLE